MTTGAIEEQSGVMRRLAATERPEAWWIGPLLTVLGLGAFIVYSTWAAFQNNHYLHKNYLSPFYSPVVLTQQLDASGNPIPGAAPASDNPHSAWIGDISDLPFKIPAWVPFSPAFLILIFPGAFRFTCYYYRKAYYRSFTASPPGCAVGALPQPGGYLGESRWLLFQNLHRYALYFAVLFIFILAYDAGVAYFRGGKFGVGVGSLVLTVNVLLLGGYTFGCHSLRHLIGGRDDCMFGGDDGCTVKLSLWRRSSWLNARHMLLAWCSLFWVGFSDVYVRLCSQGVIRDVVLFGWSN